MGWPAAQQGAGMPRAARAPAGPDCPRLGSSSPGGSAGGPGWPVCRVRGSRALTRRQGPRDGGGGLRSGTPPNQAEQDTDPIRHRAGRNSCPQQARASPSPAGGGGGWRRAAGARRAPTGCGRVANVPIRGPCWPASGCGRVLVDAAPAECVCVSVCVCVCERERERVDAAPASSPRCVRHGVECAAAFDCY